jgi:hypothetical protein
MIFHPRVGQRVRLHYRRQASAVMPWHGRVGVVRFVTRGSGPRNVGVEVDGRLVVAARGNLVAVGGGELGPKSTPAIGTGVWREVG